MVLIGPALSARATAAARDSSAAAVRRGRWSLGMRRKANRPVRPRRSFRRAGMPGRRGRSWKRCSDLRLRIIVLSFVRFNPLGALKPCGPRGACYLRGRSANPSSFAFRRTSSSSRQRKLPVSRARWSTGMSKRRRRGPRDLGSARGCNYYPARRMHGAGRIRWTNMR